MLLKLFKVAGLCYLNLTKENQAKKVHYSLPKTNTLALLDLELLGVVTKALKRVLVTTKRCYYEVRSKCKGSYMKGRTEISPRLAVSSGGSSVP